MNPEDLKKLLKLGLNDLAEFLWLENDSFLPIATRHADHMNYKFENSDFADSCGIESRYEFTEDNKELFLKLLAESASNTFNIHLIMENPYSQLGTPLIFAFEFSGSSISHILLNGPDAIEINSVDLGIKKGNFNSSQLKIKFDEYLSEKSANVPRTLGNTQKILVDMSLKKIPANDPLFFYPTIQTLNIFNANYHKDNDNIEQLFSFGLMISNQAIAAGSSYRTFGENAVVNDRFQNCPPRIC